MVVILPKKIDGLAEVEKKLSAKSLQEDVAKVKPGARGRHDAEVQDDRRI